MGLHDTYGKMVMRGAVGSAFRDSGTEVQISYGAARGGATIDGVVGDAIAVEIESRVSKQVRGAVLDLICHPRPKKLLVLLPMHMSNPVLCAQQCEHILGRFLKAQDYRVVLLAGTGSGPSVAVDEERVRVAVGELGFSTPGAVT